MRRSLSRVCFLTIFAVAESLLLALAGCGGGTGVVVDSSGPNVKNPTVNPALLSRFVGGQVVIRAVVTDDSGVKKVTAQVVRQSDGQVIADVTMQRVGANQFEVTITAPANTRDDGQSEVYRVTIFATDKQRQKTTMADGTFEVPAPPIPPMPPNP
jgi:hypothetical protein